MNKTMSTVSNFAIAFGCCSILSGLTPVCPIYHKLNDCIKLTLCLCIVMGWCHASRWINCSYLGLDPCFCPHIWCGSLFGWNLFSLSYYWWSLYLGIEARSPRMGTYYVLVDWLVQLAWFGKKYTNLHRILPLTNFSFSIDRYISSLILY